MCSSEGVNPSDHTSGWRIGTQPASFSYSSIASAILVVMLAEHCGKQEAVQGGTIEEEGRKRREDLSETLVMYRSQHIIERMSKVVQQKYIYCDLLCFL